MTVAISVQEVSKSFGGLRAVRNLNLTVKQGEIRGVLGPNGSGKSTTMKMIAGILKPDYGTINLLGVNAVVYPVDAKKIVGYVPETAHLYDYLTVAEYLDFIGIAYRIPPTIRKQRADELLQALQMEKHVNEVMNGFSQGMKQKIAITAAVLNRPKILVLDEPLNGLDPRSARIVKQLIHRLADEGAAILFSTHVLEIAEAICHQITIMNDGSILAEGSVQDLRDMAGLAGSSFEEIFLKLTGSEDTANIVEALRL